MGASISIGKRTSPDVPLSKRKRRRSSKKKRKPPLQRMKTSRAKNQRRNPTPRNPERKNRKKRSRSPRNRKTRRNRRLALATCPARICLPGVPSEPDSTGERSSPPLYIQSDRTVLLRIRRASAGSRSRHIRDHPRQARHP